MGVKFRNRLFHTETYLPVKFSLRNSLESSTSGTRNFFTVLFFIIFTPRVWHQNSTSSTKNVPSVNFFRKERTFYKMEIYCMCTMHFYQFLPDFSKVSNKNYKSILLRVSLLLVRKYTYRTYGSTYICNLNSSLRYFHLCT
jgi:hypothetical protein